MKKFSVAIFCGIVPIVCAPVASAAPGSLDSTFGTAGIVTTDIAGVSLEEIHDIAIDSQGRIVAVGRDTSTGGKFLVARYNSNGTLDTTFDSDGVATTTVAGATNTAQAVALQSDGKIVVAGLGQASGDDFGVARYNTDGSLDTSFSGDGLTTVDFSGGEQANDVKIQSDGKIVLAGFASGRNFAAARLSTDGSLDTSFDSDGKVTNNLSAGDDEAQAVVIQSDGKIVLAGRVGTTGNIGLVRYSGADGSLDTTFNVTGTVDTVPAGITVLKVWDLALTSDGKIVIVGENGLADSSFMLARFTSAGAVDTTFGTSGGVLTNIVTGMRDFALDVEVDPDGRLVVAGASGQDGTTTGKFALARYESNGTLDLSFGTAGIAQTDIGTGSDGAYAVRRQTDGKYVTGGFSYETTERLALARYDGDPADLAITAAADRSSLTVGDSATISLTVKNNGPQTASGVTLTETVPSGMTLTALSPAQGTCTSTTCSLGSLTSGASTTVTATLRGDSAGSVTNSATVSGTIADSVSTNNTATTALTVAAAATATALPTSSDTTAPTVKVKLLSKRLKRVISSRKLGLKLTSDEAATVTLKLTFSSGRKFISRTVKFTKAGQKFLTVKLPKAAVSALRRNAKTTRKKKKSKYYKFIARTVSVDATRNSKTKKTNLKLRRK